MLICAMPSASGLSNPTPQLSSRVSAMTDAIQAPRPGPDDTNSPDEQKKIHRAETKTRTAVEAKREGPTLEVIKADERVKVFIRSANQQTGAIGYTEHGERHATPRRTGRGSSSSRSVMMPAAARSPRSLPTCTTWATS